MLARNIFLIKYCEIDLVVNEKDAVLKCLELVTTKQYFISPFVSGYLFHTILFVFSSRGGRRGRDRIVGSKCEDRQ
jgi:hypothetical protein